MLGRRNRHNFGKKETHYDQEKELSWMDYSGLLDMEIEFTADLGETNLSVSEILKLDKGSIINIMSKNFRSINR